MPGDINASRVILLAHFDAPAVSGVCYDQWWAYTKNLWFASSSADAADVNGWNITNATAQLVDGAGSGYAYYFTGNASYALRVNTTNTAFGTGDFTVEIRVYPFNLSGMYVFDWRPASTEGKYPCLTIANGNTVAWHADNGVWWYSDPMTTVYRANQWNHFAASRTSGVLRLFCNGVKVYEGADTTNYLIAGTGRPIISGYGPNPPASGGITGYAEEFRMTVGVGRYVANFTPAQRQLPVALSSPVQLELQDSMYESYQPHTRLPWLYAGSPMLSTAQYKFGGKSLYLATDSDYIYLDGAVNQSMWDFNLGTSDFTVEMWARIDTIDDVNGNGLFCIGHTAPYRGLEFYVGGGGDLRLRLSTDGTNTTVFGTGAGTVTAGQWYHFAAVRASGMIYLFINGVSMITPTSYPGAVLFSGTTSSTTASKVYIGRHSTNSAAGLNGYMDELRLTIGAGRYTANFTPQVAPYTLDQTSVSGTVIDESANPVALPVYAYSEYDGRLLGGAMSSAVDGSFSIPVSERCYCVCVHPSKNAQVYAHIDPV